MKNKLLSVAPDETLFSFDYCSLGDRDRDPGKIRSCHLRFDQHSLLSATQATVSQSTKAETVSPKTREIATSTFALTGDVLRSLGQTSLSRTLPDELITDQQVERLSKQVASRCEALGKVSAQGEDGILDLGPGPECLPRRV
jgi:hypothetical protein